MQKSVIIVFHEVNLQCDECKKSFTPHTWNAEIQLRQRVDHKRTFLYLEQLILKNNAHDKCINIEEKDDGLNFYFRHRSHAISLMEFIQNNILVKIKQSSKVVSQDLKNNTSNTKHSISIEIVPICKDDLILLPQKLSRELGGIGPLVLCYKVSKTINVVDVCTMETYEIDGPSYWKHPFTALTDRRSLSTFMVMNIDTSICDVNESKAAKRNHFKFAEIELQKESETGAYEKSYFTKTHLGDVLNYNDTVLAYDLETSNLKDEQIAELENCKKQLPEVIIVRKSYPRTRSRMKNKKRDWKLKRFDFNKETGAMEVEEAKDKSSKGGKKGGKQSKKTSKDQDYEIFLQDIEEDKELRSQVKLFKVDENNKDTSSKKEKKNIDEKKDNTDEKKVNIDEKKEINEEKESNSESKQGADKTEIDKIEDQTPVQESIPAKQENYVSSDDEDENFPEIKPDELE